MNDHMEITLRFTKHSLERLFERRISPQDCKMVFKSGEIIASYPDDKPFPSHLYLGFIGQKAVHIVAAIENNIAHLITAYEPDLTLWEADFKTRRKK